MNAKMNADMNAEMNAKMSAELKDPALILFDVDGTIFDSQDVIVKGFEEAFDELGYAPPERADILNTVGLSLDRAIAMMRPDFDGAMVEAMAHAYVGRFKGKRELPMPFYDGMKDLLTALCAHEHLWLGVATGKSRRGLDPLLEVNGIAHIFAIKQTADVHPSKPAPDMITEALARYGVAPERTVMIGDTSYDIEMGQNAGVKTIGVNWGYHGERVAQARPDHVISKADEINQILKDWDFI